MMHLKALSLPVLLLIFINLITACAPVPTGSGGSTGTPARPLPTLITANRQYSPYIRTVQLFPDGLELTNQLLPAVTSIGSKNRLVLHFDDLRQERQDYSVRILHCDYTWDISRISTLEYLYDYNEFQITDFSYSYNTLQPYVHYRFQVPEVKLSGNYVLVVYQNRNPNDIVLTRRFMVYDNLAPVRAEFVTAPGATRLQRQQIDLEVLYRSLPEIIDPMSQIRIVIRQNERWDNAVVNLRPSSDRTGEQLLEYRLFDLSNTFWAGNEYRFFDLRTVRASGQNVGTIRVDSVQKVLDAFLLPDKPRGRLAYAQREDFNGDFIIDNQDYTEAFITGEYADVHFFLKSEEPLPWPVYVGGAFSNYVQAPPYLMQYDAELGGYRADVPLKQGWYNYLYLVGNKENALTLEGTFSETENFYEVFVYFRPTTKPVDLLVGYTTLRTGRGR